MGQPKALLEYEGKTFLERILSTIAASPIHDVVVVLGHDAEAILERVSISRWTLNSEYEKGMTTSFQAGIRVLPETVRAAMLFLVDHPQVDRETIVRLVEKASEGSIVIPVFGGRRGHPVLFGREALAEVMALASDRGTNEVVRARPERVIEVAVRDPGVLLDIDTPEEFRKLGQSW
jgi:molybdenum cofactor cytidylyltransferase